MFRYYTLSMTERPGSTRGDVEYSRNRARTTSFLNGRFYPLFQVQCAAKTGRITIEHYSLQYPAFAPRKASKSVILSGAPLSHGMHYGYLDQTLMDLYPHPRPRPTLHSGLPASSLVFDGAIVKNHYCKYFSRRFSCST